MKNPVFIIVISLFCLSFHSCKKELPVQDNRSFYMGVTPFPPDFTSEGLSQVYRFINSECDMITNHFDNGIPWQQALDGSPMPVEIEQEVNARLSNNQGRVVYLALAPLSLTRNQIAEYWGNDTPTSIVDKWKEMPFDDTLVSEAYLNFCQYLIEKFQPKFFNYAVECNGPGWAPGDFDKFEVFLQRVYTRLKLTYPQLPIFTSYMVSMDQELLDNAKKLNPYSDYVAISSYPYLGMTTNNYGSTDPALIPKNWYSRFREIDETKPFAVAETGYIAEDLDVPEYGISKKGDPVWQADFLQQLFETCNDYNAVFITYFCAYDYDNGYNTLQAMGLASPLFLLWKDIGLYDGSGLARPSLQVWKKWYKADKLE